MYRYCTARFASNQHPGVVDHYDSGDLLVADVVADMGYLDPQVTAFAAAFDAGRDPKPVAIESAEPGSSLVVYLGVVTYAEAVEG